MIIKKAKCEIVEVIPDANHKIDDEGTRKALEVAKKLKTSGLVDEKKSLEN